MIDGPATVATVDRHTSPIKAAAGPIGRATAIVGVVVAGSASGPLVELGSRIIRLEGAPALAPGTRVIIDVGDRVGGALGSATLRRDGAPPVTVRLEPVSVPATLPARPSASMVAMLELSDGRGELVGILVTPEGSSPSAPDGELAEFLAGQSVRGRAGAGAELTIGGATLKLPLTPRELPPGSVVAVRLSGPMGAAQHRADSAPELPHLSADHRLAAGLETALSTWVADGASAGAPFALIGAPGVAAVVRTFDPHHGLPDGQRRQGEEGRAEAVALEVDYPRLGRVQITARVVGSRLEVTLRSEGGLDGAVRGGVEMLARAACEPAGWQATTSFLRLSAGEGGLRGTTS